MIANYYIIRQVAAELDALLRGKEFTVAFSQFAGSLQLVFDDDIVVVASLNPSQATLYNSRSISAKTPKRNTISFFRELEGKRVATVSIAETDRLVTIAFDEYALVFRFYNSPNAILYRGEELLSSFKKEPTEHKKLEAAATPSQLFGKILLREFQSRNISEAEFDRLLRTSKHAMVYGADDDLLLSPIALQSRTDGKQCNSTSDGIELVLQRRRRKTTFSTTLAELRSKLELVGARTDKAISDIEHGLTTSSRADRYRAIADAITAEAFQLPKGTEHIRFTWLGEDTEAPLDAWKSPYENAAIYYARSRASLEAHKELLERQHAMVKNKERIDQLLAELETCDSLKALDLFEERLRKESFLLEKSTETAERSNDPLDRFRRFRVAGGFEVLAGKNAKQNDELTMKIAAKEDLWFHARHVTGSHVLLRTAGRKEIPREAIQQAAQIAAYFSDARTQGLAPVAYTRRKFVRKPKGAAVGSVLMEKEEVLMVEPLEPK